MKGMKIDWTLVAIAILAISLSAYAPMIPGWIRYSSQVAIASGLAALGVMLLLRMGLLSFGQGLFYFVGAYTVALTNRHLAVSDAIALVFLGALFAGSLAVPLGFFIAKYRGIFFAMLTLACTMLVYGFSVKSRWFGGSDGLNVGQMSFLGYRPRGADLQLTTFLLCVWVGAAFAVATHLFVRSRIGKISEAIEDNEIRVEYLGRSVKKTIHMVYVLAAVLAGAGGALAGIVARHVDPAFAYWTTAGEFVFIVLLSGQVGVLSQFAGSLFLEFVRTFASAFFPDAWQFAQGAIMLLVVLFLPEGIGHLLTLLRRALKASSAKEVACNPLEQAKL